MHEIDLNTPHFKQNFFFNILSWLIDMMDDH